MRKLGQEVGPGFVRSPPKPEVLVREKVGAIGPGVGPERCVPSPLLLRQIAGIKLLTSKGWIAWSARNIVG